MNELRSFNSIFVEALRLVSAMHTYGIKACAIDRCGEVLFFFSGQIARQNKNDCSQIHKSIELIVLHSIANLMFISGNMC